MTQEKARKIFKSLSDMSRLRIVQSLTRGDMYTELLAERLGLRFTDTDDVVRTFADATIPEIFARQGEEGFRRLESAAIESLAGEQGLVIATGGGAVLNPENVRSLRQNGVLLFLDRDPGMLRPTADRPLSGSRSELESLYNKRLPVYIKSADCRISNDGTPEEAVERILTIIDKV